MGLLFPCTTFIYFLRLLFPNATYIFEHHIYFCAASISNPTCKGEGCGYLQTKAAAQD